uniref:Uncharacterized protein n=1 Tax=Aegilops tauschii subsp. strangulata TaxID=200361 RepID=A0A453F9S6_AEGTS
MLTTGKRCFATIQRATDLPCTANNTAGRTSKNVGDVEDASGWRSSVRKRLQHHHTKDGSKLAAGDKIHAHISCTDAESNITLQIDDLASSLAQLHLGPATPSIAVYETNQPPSEVTLWPPQRIERRGWLQVRRASSGHRINAAS